LLGAVQAATGRELAEEEVQAAIVQLLALLEGQAQQPNQKLLLPQQHLELLLVQAVHRQIQEITEATQRLSV
jgi:hypothetical protein